MDRANDKDMPTSMRACVELRGADNTIVPAILSPLCCEETVALQALVKVEQSVRDGTHRDSAVSTFYSSLSSIAVSALPLSQAVGSPWKHMSGCVYVCVS